jgi:hypothetical protein
MVLDAHRVSQLSERRHLAKASNSPANIVPVDNRS